MTATTDDESRPTTWLDLPDAPQIAGLTFRRPRLTIAGEYAAIADVINRSNAADDVQWRITPELVLEDFETLGRTDPSTDIVLVEVEGELVAMAEVDRVIRDGICVFESYGYVVPRWRRRGLGRALLRQNLRRARELSALEPAGVEVRVRSELDEGEAGHAALLSEHGFEVIRWSFLLQRDLGAPIPEAPIPDGLEFRPVQPTQHRVLFDAQSEAFRDHWAYRAPTEEDFRALYARAELDTDLWVAAWDGDEVAGVIENCIWVDENRQLGVSRGWHERVSVRRPWRRRGLARAMLSESLGRLREAGIAESMLGVDAENPTGALGLYEGLGFRLHRREMTYDLRLDPLDPIK